MTTPPSRRRSPSVRCKLCGAILPGWLPIQNVPNGAMLLHHLGDWHPDVVGTYLDRMQRDDEIGPVAMEAFERVEGQLRRGTHAEHSLPRRLPPTPG